MNNPEVNLHLINALRHNFEMLHIVRNVEGSGMRAAIGMEMQKFNEGLSYLTEGKFANFTEWFMANTSPTVQEVLADAIREGLGADLNPD